MILHHKNNIQDSIFCNDGLVHLTQDSKAVIWKNITRNLYNPDLGEFDTRIASELFQNFIPKSVDYYQKNYTAVYDISMLDEKNILLRQTITFTVVTCIENVEFRRSFFVWKTKAAGDRGSIEVDEIKIDEENCKDKVICDPDEENDDYVILQRRFLYTLQEKKEYQIKTIATFVHSIELNPYRRFAFSKFTDGFQVLTNYDKSKINVNIELLDNRLEPDFKDIFTDKPENGKEIDRLLVPSDGYLIITNPKM